jgi:hypothetical protein
MYHPFKASIISTSFMETIQNLHGVPKIIVSDIDPIFTGKFWTKLFFGLGTQLAHNSSYHPQFDGQSEIVNKCLEGYLPCFAYDKQTQWVKWFSLAEWWYNTSFHTSLKMSLILWISSSIDQITLERDYNGSSSGEPHREPTKGSQTFEEQLGYGTK